MHGLRYIWNVIFIFVAFIYSFEKLNEFSDLIFSFILEKINI